MELYTPNERKLMKAITQFVAIDPIKDHKFSKCIITEVDHSLISFNKLRVYAHPLPKGIYALVETKTKMGYECLYLVNVKSHPNVNDIARRVDRFGFNWCFSSFPHYTVVTWDDFVLPTEANRQSPVYLKPSAHRHSIINATNL